MSASNRSKTIQTTGDLRDFLANVMVGVKNGTIDLDKASRITNLAGKINESFYAEVKVAKIRAEAGEAMPALGGVRVGEVES